MTCVYHGLLPCDRAQNTSMVWEVRMTWPHEGKFVRIDYLGSGGGSINTADISVISEGAVPPGKAELPEPTKTPEKPAPTPAKPAPSGCSSGAPIGTPATPGGGKIYYASPGDDLGQLVSALQPGDTLYLRGGVYDKEFSSGEIPSGTS
jgi:hypothetical protein